MDSYSEQKIININSTEEEITLYIVYDNYYAKNFYLYYIDNEEFTKATNILKSNKLDIISFKEHTIEGNIYLNDNEDLYTSIPYDEGWQVFVDGKKAETYALGDALLTVKCSKGNHKIKFVYKIPHFKLGIILSSIALIILLVPTILKHLKKEQNTGD